MRDVTEYAGVKYSLRPHGLKSKFVAAFFAFVLAFGGALALALPAQAAGPTQVFVTVCGNNSTWYVNPDEWTANLADDGQGDRRPLATSDGLVFSPSDLIHHQLDFPITSTLTAGTYVGNPKPDIPDFFSIEVADGLVIPDPTYATLRWNEDLKIWEVTVSGTTTSNADPVALLTAAGKSLHGRSFGVGYTNNPAGTVASLVSSISFKNVAYSLSCPIAAPAPITKTIFKTVTVAPTPDPVATTTADPMAGLNTNPVTSTEPPFTLSPEPKLVPVSNGKKLLGWGVAVAGITGVMMVIAGVAGVARRRQRQGDEYQGSHHVDNSSTKVIPAVGGDDYNVDDYHPSRGYDPRLGGYAGESRLDLENTEENPTVGPDDTKPMPKVE